MSTSRCVSLSFFALAIPLGAVAHGSEPDLPNILWITAEDMSPTLGCYGDKYAKTPNIDRLAEQSVRYTNAFATAPVCSPSRSCLITGCYATSLGTQQMRSAFPLPKSIRGFPAYLREAGYYTSNNFKTDYNTSSAPRLIEESWDESSTTAHWRNQKREGDDAKPFFSVFNIMTSHQSRSMVWTQARFRSEVQSKLSQADVHDPDEAPIPAYYPDTLVTRRIVARYYDCVTAMDGQVGEILKQLEEDGLAEDTIVFFYSDHGSGMPRHKRLLHDSGMHVPLLIRFPEKWKHLAPKAAGESTDRLVSFVDFAPTVLKLANIDAPSYMQGIAFLGDGSDAESAQRKYVFGHRDRIDEVIDLSRSVRDKRYLYIRNYMPHQSWNQYSSYSDLSEIRHEMYYVADRELAEPGFATGEQKAYAGPSKPMEELYDCVADPWNLRNLSKSSKHQEKLNELRNASKGHLTTTRDLGFIPESYAAELFEDGTPWETAREEFGEDMLSRMATDNWLSERQVEDATLAFLSAKTPSIRYWSLIRLLQFKELSPGAEAKLGELLEDPAAAVRIEAANALARFGHIEKALPVLQEALKSDDLNVVLHATRTVELLGKKAAAAETAMRAVASRAEKLQAATTNAVFDQSGEQDLAMFCSFSANGFLERLRQGPWLDLLEGENAVADKWSNANEAVKFDEDQATVELLSRGKNLWIVYTKEFADFELTLDAKMPIENYNAGIGFRCKLKENGRPLGYQCEIAEQLSGSLYAIGSGGWVWPKGEDQQTEFYDRAGDAFRKGKWNHFRVRCLGKQIRIWVNGILTTDIEDTKHSSGRIALQHHGKGETHYYRNVRVRELNQEEIND